MRRGKRKVEIKDTKEYFSLSTFELKRKKSCLSRTNFVLTENLMGR